MYKKIIINFFFLIIYSFSTIAIQAQEKIAFVDLNFVLNNSNAGKKINLEIEKKTKKINSEFEQFKKKLIQKKIN